MRGTAWGYYDVQVISVTFPQLGKYWLGKALCDNQPLTKLHAPPADVQDHKRQNSNKKGVMQVFHIQLFKHYKGIGPAQAWLYSNSPASVVRFITVPLLM